MTVQINGDTGVSLVQDNTIQTADIVSGAVTYDKLATASVGSPAPQRTMLMAAKATTSGTFVDFSPADGTGIPSWAKKITFTWSRGSTNGGSMYLVRLGTSAGVVSTGYIGAGANMLQGAAINSNGQTSGIPLAGNIGAGTQLTVTATLVNQGNNTWVVAGSGAMGDVAVAVSFGGDVTLPGTLDRVRLTTVNGTDTFDAGSVSLLIEG